MKQCREADTVCQIEGTDKEVESQGNKWPVRSSSSPRGADVSGDRARDSGDDPGNPVWVEGHYYAPLAEEYNTSKIVTK